MSSKKIFTDAQEEEQQPPVRRKSLVNRLFGALKRAVGGGSKQGAQGGNNKDTLVESISVSAAPAPNVPAPPTPKDQQALAIDESPIVVAPPKQPTPTAALITKPKEEVWEVQEQDKEKSGNAKSGEESQQDDDNSEAIEQAARELLGNDIVEMLTSSTWGLRRDGVNELAARIAERPQDANEETIKLEFCVYMKLLHDRLQDKVGPVYFAAFDAFRSLMKSHAVRLTHADIKDRLSPVIPALLTKMSDSNRRTQREACRCLLRVARTPSAGVVILTPHVVSAELPLRPRLNLLRLLIPEFKLSSRRGLSLAIVMGVAVPALQIADDKTRTAAVAVVVAAYAVAGKRVRKHLSNVKPVLLKILQRKFAEQDAINNNDGGAGGNEAGSSSAADREKARPNTVGSDLPSLAARGNAYLPSLGDRANLSSAPAGARGLKSRFDSQPVLGAIGTGKGPEAVQVEASSMSAGISGSISEGLTSSKQLTAPGTQFDATEEQMMSSILASS